MNTNPQPDETGVARQHISFTVDFDGDGKADGSLLPKYDPEGYEYIYCVKEVTQSRADSNHYKQVFGEVQDDDTLLDRIEVNGSIVEDTEGKRRRATPTSTTAAPSPTALTPTSPPGSPRPGTLLPSSRNWKMSGWN